MVKYQIISTQKLLEINKYRRLFVKKQHRESKNRMRIMMGMRGTRVGMTRMRRIKMGMREIRVGIMGMQEITVGMMGMREITV